MKNLIIIPLLLLLTQTCFAQSEDLLKKIDEGYNAIQKYNASQASNYFNSGLANMNAGNYRGAIDAFTKSIKLVPAYAPSYYYRGVCKCYMGQYNAGITDFNSAIKNNSFFGEAYRERGVAKAALGNYKGACADFRKASSMGAYADDLINQYCR